MSVSSQYSPVEVLEHACELHFTSLQNALELPLVKNHVFTPAEGYQLYQGAIDQGSAHIRLLKILADAGIPAVDCDDQLNLLCESEDLPAVQILLQAGAKPTEVCVRWAVYAIDFQMLDVLYEYGAEKEWIVHNIEDCLQEINEEPQAWAKEFYSQTLVNDLQAYVDKLDQV